MNMMEQVIDIPQQEIITKDNATVTVDGVAFFQVFDAAKASYEVANSIRHHRADHDQHPLGHGRHGPRPGAVASRRDQRAAVARGRRRSVAMGVKVNRIEIKDIVPPADLVASMGRQMKAEREKRAEILTAEGQRSRRS
jgi:regulator of protease activity HflC (stomatin/prohibitin superfamily)